MGEDNITSYFNGTNLVVQVENQSDNWVISFSYNSSGEFVESTITRKAADIKNIDQIYTDLKHSIDTDLMLEGISK